MFSFTSQYKLSTFAPRPAPEVPDFASIIDVASVKIPYGTEIFLKVEILSTIGGIDVVEVNYDKFFNISKLQLTNKNSETIDVFNNETNIAHSDYGNISIYTPEDITPDAEEWQ